MISSDRRLALVLRLFGGLDLCALAAVLLPQGFIEGAHRALGMGSFPAEPIALYLVRTTSALYALHGAMILFVSFDVERYRPLIRFLALAALVHGAVIFGIDLALDLPLWWRCLEGPAFAASGAIVLALMRGRSDETRTRPE